MSRGISIIKLGNRISTFQNTIIGSMDDYDRLHYVSCFIRLGPDRDLVDKMVFHTILRF